MGSIRVSEGGLVLVGGGRLALVAEVPPAERAPTTARGRGSSAHAICCGQRSRCALHASAHHGAPSGASTPCMQVLTTAPSSPQVQPADPGAAAMLGVALCWASGRHAKYEATRYLQNCVEMRACMCSPWRPSPHRYLQNCVEMLRDRMAVTFAALNQSPLPDAAAATAAAAAAARTSGSASGTAAMPEEHALADAAFDRAMAGSHSSGSEMASRSALLEALLSAGQEPEEAAAVFECLAQRGSRREMVSRRQWRAAVALAAARGAGAVTGAGEAAAVHEGGGNEGSAGGPCGGDVRGGGGSGGGDVRGGGGSGGGDVRGGGGSGGGDGAVVGDGVDARTGAVVGGRRHTPNRLSIEGVDTLFLYIGCSLYAQQLLMKPALHACAHHGALCPTGTRSSCS